MAIKTSKVISQLLKNLNDKEDMAFMIIKGLETIGHDSIITETAIPNGIMWYVRSKEEFGCIEGLRATIRLVQQPDTKKITINVTVKDGASTTFNHSARHEYTEDDKVFFNLLVKINKNCLLR